MRRLPRLPTRPLLAGLIVSAVPAGAVLWAARAVPLPDAHVVTPHSVASLRVEDRSGSLLREVLSRPDGRSNWVGLDEISPHVVRATLVGEDRRFFRHGGVDSVALVRAAYQAAVHRRVVSGASTLTMQLARLLVPLPHTVGGKVRQMVLAWKLERVLTKDQVLWQYLNRAPYGDGAIGIEAAARRYLNKPASQLSLAEATLLAALPRRPSGYHPGRHARRLVRRQRYLLGLMVSQGLITTGQHRRALAEPTAWEAAARPFLAPHLVDHIIRTTPRGARRIRTTLHLPLQREVETAVTRTVRRLGHRGITNAAVLVVDNATGEVLAHVGSAAYFDQDGAGQVDGTLARRQPGSTMKPFTYALALEMGLTPASLLQDLPAHFATDQGDYAPRNYDESFHGPVRLRVALGSSYNVPAVRVARYVGVDRLLHRLRGLGLASLDKPGRFYGLGLTLGNGEVTLHELVASYATLARGGTYRPLRRVLAARDAGGRPLPLDRGTSRRVISRQVAYLVTHMLADPMARLPAFGRDTVLDWGYPAAVKTGTSKDFRDNWTVGYTPRHTVGVWVGNFDGSSMHNVSGISGAGPLWAEVMDRVTRLPVGDTRASEPGPFARPLGLVTRTICPVSGGLAGSHCPSSVPELFLGTGDGPDPCRFHRQVAVDRRNGLLAGPGCPPAQVEHRLETVYPPVYRAWAAARGLARPTTEPSPLCPVPRKSSAEAVRIRFPRDGDRFFVDPDLRTPFQRLPLEAVVRGRSRWVRWLVDGRPVAKVAYPYTARWPIRPGAHTIVAVLPDGNISSPVRLTVR